MSRPRIPFHEMSYALLERAESRLPHPSTPMLPGNRGGPVKMWVCSRAHCGEISYTYSSHSTPECSGGLQWSFTTSLGYVRGVHKAWLG